MMNASREILIVSPFVTKRQTPQMLQYMGAALGKGIKTIVVTSPVSDLKDKSKPALEEILDLLKKAGVQLVFKSNVHQKFAVLDQRIIWYGSINLLSFGSSEESIMRLESPNIAHELIRSIS